MSPKGFGRALRNRAEAAGSGVAWQTRRGWGFAIRASAGLFELWAVPLSADLTKRPGRAMALRDAVAKGAGATAGPLPYRGGAAYVWRWAEQPGQLTRRQARREHRGTPQRHVHRYQRGQRKADRKAGRKTLRGAPALDVWRRLRARHQGARAVLGNDAGGDLEGRMAARADSAYSSAVAALDKAQSDPKTAYDHMISAYRLLLQLQREALAANFTILAESILYLAQNVGEAARVLGAGIASGTRDIGGAIGDATESILGGKPYDFWSDAWWFGLAGLAVGGGLLLTGGGQQILSGVATIPAGVGYGAWSLGEANVILSRPIGKGMGKLIGNLNPVEVFGSKVAAIAGAK